MAKLLIMNLFSLSVAVTNIITKMYSQPLSALQPLTCMIKHESAFASGTCSSGCVSWWQCLYLSLFLGLSSLHLVYVFLVSERPWWIMLKNCFMLCSNILIILFTCNAFRSVNCTRLHLVQCIALLIHYLHNLSQIALHTMILLSRQLSSS